jgi:hypothetical protein
VNGQDRIGRAGCQAFLSPGALKISRPPGMCETKYSNFHPGSGPHALPNISRHIMSKRFYLPGLLAGQVYIKRQVIGPLKLPAFAKPVGRLEKTRAQQPFSSAGKSKNQRAGTSMYRHTPTTISLSSHTGPAPGLVFPGLCPGRKQYI